MSPSADTQILRDGAGFGPDVRDYVALLKPRVMSLVVFTALTGLVCAGAPMNPLLAGAAILCIAVGAGGSGALNMGYEGKLDALMRRTRSRPVAAGRVQRADALGLGVVFYLLLWLIEPGAMRAERGARGEDALTAAGTAAPGGTS